MPLGVGRPLWVDDDDFAITRHVKAATVPEPGDEQQLYDLCAELFEEPINRAHPLWQIWIVDGLAGGRVGIVEKIHHALIDGISGVELAAAIFDPAPDAEPDTPVRATSSPGPSGLRLFTDAVVDRAGNVWAANNWNVLDALNTEDPIRQSSTQGGGDGLVVIYGVAAPVKTPVMGPVQPAR